MDLDSSSDSCDSSSSTESSVSSVELAELPGKRTKTVTKKSPAVTPKTGKTAHARRTAVPVRKLATASKSSTKQRLPKKGKKLGQERISEISAHIKLMEDELCAKVQNLIQSQSKITGDISHDFNVEHFAVVFYSSMH